MTKTTTTEEPCPTQYCNAACTLIGAIAACRTTCVTPTGTSCSATSTPIQVTTTATIPWTVSVNDLEPEPTPSFYARILPLGAPIVWGVGSSTGNGAIPNATIICSTVIPGTANGIPQNRDTVNAQIKALVNDRQNNGEKIVLVDVDFPAGVFTTDYLISDGIHPTDEGHRRLAEIYLDAFETANDSGFISPPSITGQSDGSGGNGNVACDKMYGSGASHGPVNTQEGSGLDDGAYIHDSKALGVILKTSSISNYHEDYTFARLREPFGYHDLVHILDVSRNQRAYDVYYNTGCQFSSEAKEIYIGDTCIAGGVRFVDVNGKPINY
ncbi:hypothetical protein EIK77_007894 [Talaromyces pinophilus]|nr:hypothetical protein EIK77_007894 [Talaromyces pinophilus]